VSPIPHASDIEPIWEDAPADAAGPATEGQGLMLRRDALLRRALAAGDVISAYLALFLAIGLVAGGSPALRWTTIAIAPVLVLVAKTIGLYDRDQYTLRKTTIDEVPSLLNLAVFYSLIVWLAESVLFDGWLTRAQVFTLALAALLCLFVARVIVRALVLRVHPAERCVVLGSVRDADHTDAKLRRAIGVNACVIGRVALGPGERHGAGASAPLGDMTSLTRIIAEHGVERVIIAPDSHDQQEILDAVRLVKALGVKVSVLPRLLEVVGSSSTFDDVDGITLLGVRHFGLSTSSGLLKRTLDIVASGAGLLVLAPLLAFLAAAVKLTSAGPVFFRQPRIGRRGARFEMLKFRSMVANADEIKSELADRNEAGDGLFKISDDPRITTVGRLLRKTSLDELPQLLNVFRGDMSLVGPRPLVPDEDALIEGWGRRRLALKPGMTGLWQVFGSARIPMNEMVKIDYLYGANWSLWLDLKILLKTVPFVLRRRGM